METTAASVIGDSSAEVLAFARDQRVCADRAAQRCELTGAGGAASGVRDDVVAVAGVLVGLEAAGGSGAPGEHAREVAQRDGFGDPVRHLVGLGVDVVERAGTREGRARSVVREG